MWSERREKRERVRETLRKTQTLCVCERDVTIEKERERKGQRAIKKTFTLIITMYKLTSTT